MIERAIEYWLTNTNERNYQAAFCQLLTKQGHSVLSSSSHGPFELGKDIVTKAPDGKFYAYQLKTGDINVSKWREIEGEIAELVKLPIQDPRVSKEDIHQSFLVTNGNIAQDVLLRIKAQNDDNVAKKRNLPILNVVTKNDLLKQFLEAHGDFIPKELTDYELFLGLYLSDGKDFLPKESFFNFFNNSIFKDIPKQISSKKDAITSSVIINSYLLNSFQKEDNYFALFQGWVCLAACIIRYATLVKLPYKDWEASYFLAFNEIIQSLMLLKNYTLKRENLLEGNITVDGGVIYRARVTIVLGTLAALENYFKNTSGDYSIDKKLIELILNNIKRLWLWGESAIPYLVNIIQYLEKNNEEKHAQQLLTSIMQALIKSNSLDSKASLPNPYYDISTVLESILGTNKDAIDYNSFVGGSYMLENLIFMLVRRGNRKALEAVWRTVTSIQFKEFIPEHVEDYLVWLNVKKGTNSGKFVKTPQSWKTLSIAANEMANIPRLLTDHKELIPFFVITCPHRLNTMMGKLIDT